MVVNGLAGRVGALEFYQTKYLIKIDLDGGVYFVQFLVLSPSIFLKWVTLMVIRVRL